MLQGVLDSPKEKALQTRQPPWTGETDAPNEEVHQENRQFVSSPLARGLAAALATHQTL